VSLEAGHNSAAQLVAASGFIDAGREDLAEHVALAVLARDPTNGQAHAIASRCRRVLGDIEGAMREADEAVRLAPGSSYAHAVRASALLERHPGESEREARETLRLDPRDPQHHAQLAAALFLQRRYRESLDSATAGLELDPQHVNCRASRSLSLLFLGRPAEARAAIRAVLATAPASALVHGQLAGFMMMRGELPDARAEALEALRLDPASPLRRIVLIPLERILEGPGARVGWWFALCWELLAGRYRRPAGFVSFILAGVVWPGAWVFAAWLGAFQAFWLVHDAPAPASARVARVRAAMLRWPSAWLCVSLLAVAGAALGLFGSGGLLAVASGVAIAAMTSIAFLVRGRLRGIGCLATAAALVAMVYSFALSVPQPALSIASLGLAGAATLMVWPLGLLVLPHISRR